MNPNNHYCVKQCRSGQMHLSPMSLKVLEHLEKSGSISNVEANAVLKCRSVSRRITELKDTGFDIQSEMRKDSTGQRYMRYTLA